MESITSLTLKKNVDTDTLSFVWKEPFLSEHKAFYNTAISWTSLLVQWLTLHFQWRGTQVLFLVLEMRSHLPCGQNYQHNKPYHFLTWKRRTFIKMEEPRYG